MVTRLDEAGIISTGSTTERSLRDRFAEIINVKDYGATGDGTTDDTVAIQAALDKGGKVYIPEGTYRISAILTMGSGTSLSGEGDNSILKPLDSSGDAVSPVLLIKNKTNVRVSSLKIDGNATNLTQASGHSAIYISASSYCTIDSVHIIDCGRESGANSAGAHIMVTAYESADSSAGANDHVGVDCIGNTIKNCILEDPDGKCGFGIRLNTNWDYEILETAFTIKMSYNKIDKNTITGFTWTGIEIVGPGAVYNTITNNIVKDYSGYGGIEADKGSSYNVFDSNIITGFITSTTGARDASGMRCQGGFSTLGKLRTCRHNVFSNNSISNLNDASTSASCFLFARSEDCSLVGNILRGSLVSGTDYGVHLADNNTDLMINNNFITDVTTGIANIPTSVASTTKNITIQSNTIEATLDGINFTNIDSSGAYIYEVYILNNILKDGMTNVGINVGTDVDNSIVRGNIIGSCISASGLTGDGIRTNGDNNIIESNQISDYNRSGINIQSSATGTVVRDNYTSSVTGTAVGILATGAMDSRNKLSVKDFGAKGDGTTDDTAAINAAKAVVVSNGGTLYFPQGTYLISDEILFTDASEFKLTGDYATIKASSAMAVADNKCVFHLYGCSDFVIENLILDGNRSGRVPTSVFAAHTLRLRSHLSTAKPLKNGIIRNVTVKNGVADGFMVSLDSNTPTEVNWPQNILFEDCISDNNYRNAATIANGKDITFRGGRYIGSTGNSAGPCAGIDIEADASTTLPSGVVSNQRILIDGVYFEDNVGLGVNINGTGDPEDCLITDCFFTNCGEDAIDTITGSAIIVSTPCIIKGNHFYKQTATGNVLVGVISVSADSAAYAIIDSNTFKDCTSASDNNWCINIHSGSVDYRTLVSGNDFSNVTRAIQNDSDGTRIINNLIETCSRIGIRSGVTGDSNDVDITGNTIKDGISRGIFSTGNTCRMLNNRVMDITSVDNGYIEIDGDDCYADYNICEKGTSSTDVSIVWGTSTPFSCRFNRWINLNAPDKLSDGTTSGTASAGAGKQSVQININGTIYKVLHDGTV